MATTTLNRKRLPGRQTHLLRVFAPLLALLASFGMAGSAYGQTVASTYYDDAVTLTQQVSGASSSNTINYAGTASDAPYNTNAYPKLGKGAPGPNLGTYDSGGTSQLILNGGSIVADPPGATRGTTYSITAARLKYRVYLQGATTLPAYNAVPLPANGTFAGSSYFYTNTANFNLLAGLSVGGTYIVEVVFQTDTQGTNGAQNTDQDPAATTFQAQFTLTAPPAPTLSGTTVYVSPNNSGNVVYNVNPATPNKYQGADLGQGATFNVNNGQLILNGGTATTTDAGANSVTNVTLYYRVYQQGTTPSSIFNYISLPQTGSSTSTQNGYTVTTRTFGTSTANINLVNNLPAAGTYNVDVYYLASGSNNSNPNSTTTFSLSDPQNATTNGVYYTANFTAVGTPTRATTWSGGINDNWFDARNWTNGIPDSVTNATIANLGSGNPNPYPNIYVDTTYTYGGQTINNRRSGPAMALNLVMSGNGQADRSILRLQIGQLKVYGTWDNTYDSFIARDYTNVNFSGTNQTIIGGGSFDGVIISGGGAKSLQGAPMNINRQILFTSGLLTTDITNPTQSVVVLADRAPINNNQGAQLVNEREGSYLRGFVRTTRANTTLEDDYTYGNMGMELVWHTNNPGPVAVTRNTVQYYYPANTTSSIRRIFGVRPGNAQASNGGLNADMVFSYLNSETKNLGPNGNISIDENNLVLFLSTNSGNTFTNLNRTAIDTVNNHLYRTGVTTFATFTLGDRTNPLPVKLVAFDAKRQGNNTLVTWATADETNNAGFEVQVSSDAKTFRKLSFVDSYSNNSTAYQTYSYTDIEANKSGVRYYRLRQVDLDGTESFSPVKAVSFATVAAGTVGISIYPNPSTTTDQTTLVVQSPVAGQGHVQVMDLTGRTIVSRDITTVAGVTEVAVPSGSELSAGIYLVKVTMPTGEVKTTRLQKR